MGLMKVQFEADFYGDWFAVVRGRAKLPLLEVFFEHVFVNFHIGLTTDANISDAAVCTHDHR